MKNFPFEAVIFDVDGTLALTANLHFDAFNAAAMRQNAAMDRAWYDARKGLDRTGLISAFAAAHDTALDVGRLARDSLAITIERAEATAVENPPIAALARRLHGHVPLGVGSNAETPIVEAVLRGAGVSALFDALVTVTEAGRAKPDPAIFTLAARQLDTDPARCLVLEDSTEGLDAARAAGMTGWDVRNPDIVEKIEALAR